MLGFIFPLKIVVWQMPNRLYTWRLIDATKFIVHQGKAYRRWGNCMNAATRAQAAATPKIVQLKKS